MLEPVVTQEIGLYLHVAFCRRKCFYCDFNVYVGLESLIERYVAALTTEMTCLPAEVAVGSLFLGGGTPSMLSPRHVADLVATARDRGRLPDGGEVTLEANPCDLGDEYLRGLRAAGVNRLSIGVQSFDDAALRRIGRRHDARQAIEAYRRSRAAGFDNVSLDLMFGLPDQGLDPWRRALGTAVSLAPEHLSLYCLTLEAGTPFEKWARAGKLAVPDDDAAADMYQAAIDTLGAAGYEHYEISNWARSAPGRDWRGQHNLRYWRNRPYLGLGAGAHSSFDGRRFHNALQPAEYVRRIEHDESPVSWSEEISSELAMGETAMLGLRLAEGIDRADFSGRFGVDVLERFGSVVSELEDLGLLEVTTSALRLTARGRPLGNEVFQRFLPPA